MDGVCNTDSNHGPSSPFIVSLLSGLGMKRWSLEQAKKSMAASAGGQEERYETEAKFGKYTTFKMDCAADSHVYRLGLFRTEE